MLSEADIEAIAHRAAQRVVELLHEQPMASSRLVDARQLAALLGVTRGYVYEHADELQAIRVGDGPRGRLRFDVDAALAAWAHRDSCVDPEPERTTPRRRGTTSSAPLLPIKERKAA